MAQWQRVLKLGDVYRAGKSIQELSGIVAKRLRALKPVGDEYLEDMRGEIAMDFSDLSGDPTSNTEDFDDILAKLYDWADTRMDSEWNGKKLCWVDTLGAREEVPVGKA